MCEAVDPLSQARIEGATRVLEAARRIRAQLAVVLADLDDLIAHDTGPEGEGGGSGDGRSG